MFEDPFHPILNHRKMPSHDWAAKHSDNLEAVTAVTEAERELIHAVDQRNDHKQSNVVSFKEADDNSVQEALFNLGATYLQHGVADTAETAASLARRAAVFINRRLGQSADVSLSR